MFGEGAGEDGAAARHQLDARGVLQAFRRAAAVGTGQAAGAELDAAEPAADQHRHAVHALPFDGGEDRPAGGAAGFAVVAEAVLRAELPGPAVVSGAGIAMGGEEGGRLGLAADRRGEAVEAALADFFLVIGRAGQGEAHALAGGISPQPLRMMRMRLSVASSKSCLDMRLRPVTKAIWVAKSA
ncbi:hypothetical protein D3C78_1048440 [compost metagenome]